MSIWIKLKMILRNSFEKAELKSVLMKSRKAIEANYIDKAVYEVEKVKAKVERIHAETDKIRLETEISRIELEKSELALKLMKLELLNKTISLLDSEMTLSIDLNEESNIDNKELKLYFNLDDYNEEEIVNILILLSETYYKLCGDDLEIKRMHILSPPPSETPLTA